MAASRPNPGIVNERAYHDALRLIDHPPGQSIDFKRPPRTLQPCSLCATPRFTTNMRSHRVPGVGAVYTCRVCPHAFVPTAKPNVCEKCSSAEGDFLHQPQPTVGAVQP